MVGMCNGFSSLFPLFFSFRFFPSDMANIKKTFYGKRLEGKKDIFLACGGHRKDRKEEERAGEGKAQKVVSCFFLVGGGRVVSGEARFLGIWKEAV